MNHGEASGHVFVFRGDLRKLACDAWYLPTDFSLTVAPEWLHGDQALAVAWRQLDTAELPPDWGPAGSRVHPLPLGNQRRAVPVLAAIPEAGTDDPEYHRTSIRQFVRRARHLPRPEATRERARRLLAVPAIGTGASGDPWHRGRHLTAVLEELADQARRYGVDIALVTADAPATAAAHALRRRDRSLGPGWQQLDPSLRDEAARLARLAHDGSLVLFTGAGLGRAAGLADWQGLLASLAQDAGFDANAGPELSNMDVLDQAALLAARLGGEQQLADRIAEHLTAPHHGLGHGLLASLPIRERVTTNYDQLHEMAADGAGAPLSVLPYEPATDRWLLKMHGCIEPGRRDDIVLTRGHYLRFAEHRAALTGLVQALLVTRHMLFVGFSLRDDHFHAIVNDVRRALAGTPRHDRLGTALLLRPDPLQQELWKNDLDYLPTGDGADTAADARRLEIFLDLLLNEANTGDEHLFDDTYGDILTPPELDLRDELRTLAASARRFAGAPVWNRVQGLLNSLGYDDHG